MIASDCELQLPFNGTLGPLHRERDSNMQVGLPFAHNHRLTQSHIHSDVATLVHTATWSVDVSDADREGPDPCREPPQAEMDPPPDVVLKIAGEVDPVCR